MKIDNFSLLIAVLAILFMSPGCSTGALKEAQPLPALSFKNYDPLPLKVSNVEIESSYDPVITDEDFSETFPVPPDVALKRYLRQKLRASGNEGLLLVNIVDAKVSHETKGSESFFGRLFGTGAKDIYSVSMRLTMILKPARGEKVRTTSIVADRTLTLPEGVSMYERDKAKLEMVERIIAETDPVLTKALRNSLEIYMEQ